MPFSFRNEFCFRNLLFKDVNPRRFNNFQWRLPGFAFFIYRIVVAVYTIVWLSITVEHSSQSEAIPEVWGAYLTNWTYVLLTTYFTYYAVVTVIGFFASVRTSRNLFKTLTSSDHWELFSEVSNTGYQAIHSEEEQLTLSYSLRPSLPWYYSIVWILLNAASVAAVMVSIVFWAILVPGSNLGQMTNDNLQLHLINSVLIVIEHALIAVPIRLLHVVWPIIYGLIYALFSVFYWVDNHSHVMYNILDWNNPGPTVGFVLLIGFVIIPVIHSIIYGLYRLKLYIFQRCCS